MYTVVSFCVLLLSYFLFNKVSGSLRLTQLNMISWVFFYNLILQSFIASVLVVNELDDHYMINKIQHEESRVYGWLAIQYTMIMLPLGMLFAVYLFGYKNNRRLFQDYVHRDITPALSIKDSYIRLPLYFLYTVSVLSVIYVLYSLKTIPLSGIILGFGHEVLAGLRVEASRDFEGNLYVRNILALGLTPILSYIAYGYYRMTKSKADFLWFIILFIASFLILTYNIAKAPFVQYLLGFVFLTILIKGSVKRKTLLIVAGSILILLVIVYVSVMGADFSILFDYNTGIVGRILLGQSAGTYLSFDLFPRSIDHIGFSSVSGVLNEIANIEGSERAARLIMEKVNPKGVELGIAGVINSLFVAEAWANWGAIGVLLAPFYVGIIIQVLFMFFLTRTKTPLLLGLFTYFSYNGSVTGGVNDYIYNAGYSIIVVFFVLSYFCGLLLKQMKQSKHLTASKV